MVGNSPIKVYEREGNLSFKSFNGSLMKMFLEKHALWPVCV